MKAAAPQVVGEQNILRKETHCRKKTNCSLPENWTACGKLMQTRVTANEGTDGLGSLSLKCHVEKKKIPLTWSVCEWGWEITGDLMATMFVFGEKTKQKNFILYLFIYLLLLLTGWIFLELLQVELSVVISFFFILHVLIRK